MRLKSKFASISCTPGDEALLVVFDHSDEEGWYAADVDDEIGRFLLRVDSGNFMEIPPQPKEGTEPPADATSDISATANEDGTEQAPSETQEPETEDQEEEGTEPPADGETPRRRGRPRKVPE